MAAAPHRVRKVGAVRLSSVTSKGQTTIPADYRRSIGLEPGDMVAFELEGDRIVLRRAQALDQAWNTAQSRFMSEWGSAEDAVFDAE
jgi:antitoxin PrlF